MGDVIIDGRDLGDALVRLANGREMTIEGIGSLEVVLYPALSTHNPRTGESVQTRARRRPHFHGFERVLDAEPRDSGIGAQILAALKNGDKAIVRGLGTFQVIVTVSRRRLVAFRAAHELIERLNVGIAPE